jgi:RNA polymerase sigma-70 factor (ECF subfamily)
VAAAATGVRASAVDRLGPEPATEAARDLYERHGAAILRFCRSRLRSREEAEDARQTTFLHALRALSRGVVPIAELSWLLKIADNVCRTRRHDARRRVAFEVTEDPVQLGRIAAPARPDVELLMPLGDALDRLTAPQRQALLLREWQGLSYKEIAAELGIGQGAVEVLLFRARRALAEELETPGKVRRGRARALDLGWLASAVKQLLGGATAIGAKSVLTAVAVAIAAAASTVAVAVGSDRDRPAPPGERDDAPPTLTRATEREVARVRGATARPAATAPPGHAPVGTTETSGTERQDAPGAERSGEAPPAESASRPSAAPTPGDTVGGVVSSVSAAAEPVVGLAVPAVTQVTEAAESAVGAVSSAVGDVVEATEPALEEPALPPPPELP